MTVFLPLMPLRPKVPFAACLLVLISPRSCGRRPGPKGAIPDSKLLLSCFRNASGSLRRLTNLPMHSKCWLTLCRPLAYRFDFLEVYAGAAKVTSYMAELGVVVGPPIDLSFSEEYDLRHSHVLAWITFLVTERLILGLILEPRAPHTA